MSNERQEIQEAIVAANNALYHLSAARDSLQSAGNWGVVDILGGGMFSTLMKHNKMNRAEQQMADARNALRSLARELADVEHMLDTSLNLGDFLSFADFFFDGVIADWLVQSRINDAKRQVADAIRQVEHIRRLLQAM